MPKVFIRNYLIFTAILLSCVVGLGFLLITGEKQIDRSDDWVVHTHETIIETEELMTLVSSMLASQRGYIISKNDEFLERYENQRAAISQHIAKLSVLTAKDPAQQSRLEELRTYFSRFTEQLETRAERSLTDDPKKVLRDVQIIENLRNNIRKIHDDFLAKEYAMLDQRIKMVERKKEQYFLTLLVGGTTAFILIMIFNGYLLRVQSKRSKAEIALSEREEVFRLAVEGTHDGVFDWNIKTGEAFYSPQYIAMLGYEPEDFEGTLEDFSSRLHEEEQEQVQEYLDLFLNGQLSEYSNTFRMRHKSGRWVWIRAGAQLITDKNGDPKRMVGAHTDVSASKKYEIRLQEAKDKAEKANRAKTDFLAHMSHEIRTPLTTISGIAEILSQNKNDWDDKTKHLISALNTSSITLKDLISDILDFSKIESGEIDLNETSFDLDEAFQHVVSIMSVRATEKNLDFIFEYDDLKNTSFYGDPIRLRQILINLVGNAIKFTEEGHVHVKAMQHRRNGTDILYIEVKDTGIGLTEDQSHLIFEHFKQADESVSRKYGGTGLGLPISRNLAKLMGGEIELESQPGKGSTFSVLLPLRNTEDTEAKQYQTQEQKNKINDKLKSTIKDTDRILLVEDYEGNIVVLGYVLEEMGIQYDVAKTGLEALNLWNNKHYNLILMDIQMPEMDGFTATTQIRHIEEEQNLDPTPIIGMTAHALVGDKNKCVAVGMDAYLPKPINEVNLKKTILKFLKLRQGTA